MKPYFFYGLIWLCPAFFSCGGLRKSETEKIEKFARLGHGIASAPPDIYSRKYRLENDIMQLQTANVIALEDDGNSTLRELEGNYQDLVQRLKQASDYEAAYGLLEKYTELLLALSSQEYLSEFSKHTDAFQASVDSLISKTNKSTAVKVPKSLGTVCGQVVSSIGKARFRQLQKKYLTKAIVQGAPSLVAICDNFLQVDSALLSNEFGRLEQTGSDHFKSFLETVRFSEKSEGDNTSTPSGNPFRYYRDYAPLYLDWLSRTAELKALLLQTCKAFRTFKALFQNLEQAIEKGTSFTNALADLKELRARYQEIKSAYDKYSEEKKLLQSSAKQ